MQPACLKGAQFRTRALQRRASLFDHPRCLRNQGGREIEADSFRGFLVDDQLKAAWSLDRQVGWTSTTQNFVDRSCHVSHKLPVDGSVTQKRMGRREKSLALRNRRNF
jgi:hypothetical protein